MRYLSILILVLIPYSSLAGTGGGGVGPRPMKTVFNPQIDWVRAVGIHDEEITFLYKPAEDKMPSIKTIRAIDLNKAYLKALSESAKVHQWMGVPVQD